MATLASNYHHSPYSSSSTASSARPAAPTHAYSAPNPSSVPRSAQQPLPHNAVRPSKTSSDMLMNDVAAALPPAPVPPQPKRDAAAPTASSSRSREPSQTRGAPSAAKKDDERKVVDEKKKDEPRRIRFSVGTKYQVRRRFSSSFGSTPFGCQAVTVLTSSLPRRA